MIVERSDLYPCSYFHRKMKLTGVDPIACGFGCSGWELKNKKQAYG